MPGGEVRVEARVHPSGRWVTVPLTVASIPTLWMVLDTGSPASAISPEVANDLEGRGLLRRTGEPGRYVLEHLSTEGQALPNLEIRVLNRLSRLGVVGLLGLDFLLYFDRVCFDARTFELVLEYSETATPP